MLNLTPSWKTDLALIALTAITLIVTASLIGWPQ